MLPTIEPNQVVYGVLGRVLLDARGAPSRAPPLREPIRIVRGDLIALHPNYDREATLIFRVIGFPGERVALSDHVVSIDGLPVPAEDIGPASSDPSYYVDNPQPNYRGDADTARLVRETLPNGATFVTLRLNEEGGYRPLSDMPVRIVPEGQVFVLGDSRDNANDSRLELGMLPVEAIRGKIMLPD